ncbi:DUF2500 domain-containing protein [Thaumasiovibrio subtropicus]|uniref:DUF2500 domain-containing protein n=1 Tax=Thaumasiovibrio subtropicus TaxID=1891207 RepID=UPI000B34E59E|nr:DUF2500 domain-containing protein [Thaumasiovibrio subtropicus]
MPITVIVVMLVLLVFAGAYLWFSLSRHTYGQGAKEKDILVKVLDKQSVEVERPLPGEETERYWIYVQPVKGGPKREFEVGIHYYHSLNSGDEGILTYQGTRFCHFALRR